MRQRKKNRPEQKPSGVELRRTGVTSRHVWLGFGASIPGPWGDPAATIRRCLEELAARGLRELARSSLYSTPPVGFVRQGRFVNAVAAFELDIAPAQLLRLTKRLEWQAGRRKGVTWGPRPLDIDILDIAGRSIGYKGRRTPKRLTGGLQVPHPEIAGRGFVLVPLAEIAPLWRHPLQGWQAGQRLRRMPHLARGIFRVGSPCAKDAEAVRSRNGRPCSRGLV